VEETRKDLIVHRGGNKIGYPLFSRGKRKEKA